jgi:hypothetical protein
VLAENAPIDRNSVFRIYDVADWSGREIDERDLDVKALSWVGNDRVLILGSVRRQEGMVATDASSPTPNFKENDVVARLIDLAGKVPPKTIMVVPSVPHVVEKNGSSRTWYESQLIGSPFLLPDSDGGKILAGFGRVIDTKTMKVLAYATTDDLVTHKFPGDMDQRNAAISPDGSRLYLKGAAKNVVLDTSTGKPVYQFDGGHTGIAISPDGKQLAIGDGSSVHISKIAQL